ncbi:hypothetical protein [Streptomyces sp. NPDC048638]|uniref:hypothetical protein n=1 Tax=Streptomyces sp. NPDC048638 TaxID=3365580 RepID=UPI003718784C
MSMPPSLAPSPDATVIRTGRRNLLRGSRVCALLLVIGLLGPFTALVKDHHGRGLVAGELVGGLVWLLLWGGLTALLLQLMWKSRNVEVAVDHTGLWYFNGQARNVIPWHTLAGVGLCWCHAGGRRYRTKEYSLELCPHQPIDRDDPVLWPLVRDEEPLSPTLPRLRHRLPLSPATQRPVADAVRRYVPQLWLGESERERGYRGLPDVKGHRERTGGHTH